MSLNTMCLEVINFLNSDPNSYDEVTYIQKKNKIETMKNMLNETLLEQKDRMLNSKDIVGSYNIFVYYVAFLEDYLTDEEFYNLSDKILLGKSNIIPNPIMYILKSKHKFSNSLTLKIMSKIDKTKIDINNNIFGKFPYDYRYYLLKREEIPMDIKEEVLETYSRNEIAHIEEIDKTLILTKE